MNSSRSKWITAVVGGVLAFAALVGSAGAESGPQAEAKIAAATVSGVSTGGQASTLSAASAPAVKKTMGQKVKALVAKLTPDRLKRDLEFKRASATFPNFCQHWEENLHEREHNNLSKLAFAIKDGFHTATYTGYGKVSGCESHQSKDGYSIGKITYEEFIYYLAGRTPDEARHATPRPVSDTHTTEIFRWENNKWFY